MKIKRKVDAFIKSSGLSRLEYDAKRFYESITMAGLVLRSTNSFSVVTPGVDVVQKNRTRDHQE